MTIEDTEVAVKDEALRTIKERITSLKAEARGLAMAVRDLEDEDLGEDDGVYGDQDIEHAAWGLVAVTDLADQPAAVAGLVVAYRPRPDWNDMDRARDIGDELREIVEEIEKAGLAGEAVEFGDELDGALAWFSEF